MTLRRLSREDQHRWMPCDHGDYCDRCGKHHAEAWTVGCQRTGMTWYDGAGGFHPRNHAEASV